MNSPHAKPSLRGVGVGAGVGATVVPFVVVGATVVDVPFVVGVGVVGTVVVVFVGTVVVEGVAVVVVFGLMVVVVGTGVVPLVVVVGGFVVVVFGPGAGVGVGRCAPIE